MTGVIGMVTYEAALLTAVASLTGAVVFLFQWFKAQFEKQQATNAQQHAEARKEIAALQENLRECERDKAELWGRIGRLESMVPHIDTSGRRAKDAPP